MRYPLFFASAIVAASYAHAEPIEVAVQKPDGIYKKGEKVEFVVKAPAGTEIEWSIGKETFPPSSKGKITLTDGSKVIEGVMDEPGFLACHIEAISSGKGSKSWKGQAVAAISPEELTPSVPPPDDFDSFWASQKELLGKIPMTVKSVAVTFDDPKVEAEDVRVTSLGAPVSGYYCKPKGAEPRKHPAILLVHGYGVHTADLVEPTRWAKEGLLAFDINAHGLPNGQPKSFYELLEADYLNQYTLRQKVSREHHYFVELFLRVARALEFLKSQPEWDGKHLIVKGSSQGGAQAVVGASLDPDVTFFVAGVPAYADVTGAKAERVSGWPKFVRDEKGEINPEAVEVARYFDIVNFIRKTKAQGAFTVGFLDPTSPPTTVYVLHNTLNAPKSIYNDVKVAHRNSPEAVQWMREEIRHYLHESQASKGE